MPRTGRGVALGLLLAVATAPTAYAACGTHTFTRQCVAFSNGDAPLTFSIQNTRNLCKAACEAFLDANNAGEGCCQYHKSSDACLAYSLPNVMLIASTDIGASSCGVGPESFDVAVDESLHELPALSESSLSVGVSGTFGIHIRESELSVVAELRSTALSSTFGQADVSIDPASGTYALAVATDGLPLEGDAYFVRSYLLPSSRVGENNWETFALHTADSATFSIVCHGCGPTTTSTTTTTPNTVTPSVTSCADLGWPSYNTELPDVCAASVINSVCHNHGSTDQSSAAAICTGVGARLCTLEELENDLTAASGCDLDDQMIWSQTPCENGFYTALGKSDGSTAPVCASQFDGHSVRCCADHTSSVVVSQETTESLEIIEYSTSIQETQEGSVTVRFTTGATTDRIRISFKQGATLIRQTSHDIPTNAISTAMTFSFSTQGALAGTTGYSLFVYITPDTNANRVASTSSAADISMIAPTNSVELVSYETDVYDRGHASVRVSTTDGTSKMQVALKLGTLTISSKNVNIPNPATAAIVSFDYDTGSAVGAGHKLFIYIGPGGFGNRVAQLSSAEDITIQAVTTASPTAPTEAPTTLPPTPAPTNDPCPATSLGYFTKILLAMDAANDLESVAAASASACADACIATIGCAAFQYKDSSPAECVLKSIAYPAASLTADDEWNYYALSLSSCGERRPGKPATDAPTFPEVRPSFAPTAIPDPEFRIPRPGPTEPREGCVDSPAGWSDTDGFACADYEASQWCNEDGTSGPGWNTAWGFLQWYADANGVTGLEACCVCGGGIDASEVTTPEPIVTELPPGSFCENERGWIDSDGFDCAQYLAENWCNADGTAGSGWSPAWGPLSNYVSAGGVSSLDACCGCGGGNIITCADEPGYTDALGFTCQNYADNNWCTDDGGHGLGWLLGWGSIRDYPNAQSGLSAFDACCVCGKASSGTTLTTTLTTTATTTPQTEEPTTASPTSAAPTTMAPTTMAPTTAQPTTAEPTTAAPTTAEPTTAAPTTAEPTTAEPTTAQPTTAEPTTAAPTTAAPTTAEPTTAAPTTAEPTTAAPTTAEPTTAEPTTAAPTTAEPTTAAPTTAEPTTAEPTTAAPTTAAPTTAAPTTAEPTTAEPTTAAPTTAEPTTAEPTTAEPTTAQPTTAGPTTMAPTTAEPTTAEPTTAAPTTAEPTTAEPTTAAPTTAAPTTPGPTTAAPTTAAPTTAEPTTAEPTTAEPTTMAPTTAEPTTMAPTTAEPTTAEPTTAAPTTAEPTTAEPTTAQPTTAEPTTAAPTTAAPTTPSPSFQVIATDPPSTGNPTTAAPTTAEPTTAAPTTAEPTTAQPTTAQPTTAEPTTAQPTTAQPTTAEPTTAEPTTAAPTTAAPSTAGPTTAAPTTAEPTTAEPTTAEPTTAQPTTAEPTTAAPTTAEPTTAEPTTAAPTTAEPTTAEPTTAEPTTAAPTTAEPTTAAPTTAAPTTAEPTTAEPTTAQPTTAEPTTAEPTTAAPTTAAPTTAAPTTATPTTLAPTAVPTATPNNLPTCVNDVVTRETFNSGFGGCATYASTAANGEFCGLDFDLTTGVNVNLVCPECGACNAVVTSRPTAAPTSPPTTTPTAAPSVAFSVHTTDERCDRNLNTRASTFTLGGGGHSQAECHIACSAQTDCFYAVLTATGFCQMFQNCDVKVALSGAVTFARVTRSPTEVPTTANPTEAPSASPTRLPTLAPSEMPTVEPTAKPTMEPTEGPTRNPTGGPTEAPTRMPTESPTASPTEEPTMRPTEAPTREPTAEPTTRAPTGNPTTVGPTTSPTHAPSHAPTASPSSGAPTMTPTSAPSVAFSVVSAEQRCDKDALEQRTVQFTLNGGGHSLAECMAACSADPSCFFFVHTDTGFCQMFETCGTMVAVNNAVTYGRDTDAPTGVPTTLAPTDVPSTAGPTTASPTEAPSTSPSHSPTDSPTDGPTHGPTEAPTAGPTDAPTHRPTHGPTEAPVAAPTHVPTDAPTHEPSFAPTAAPSGTPTTDAPTHVPSTSPTSAPTAPTAGPTRQPTGAPNSFLPCFESNDFDRSMFNSGFGDCASYGADRDNHEFCDVDFDLLTGHTALAVCFECLNCNPPLVLSPTAAPSTAAPTTPQPTTQTPTTAAPTTEAPTTATPTTAEPTTAAPTTLAPTTAQPTTAEPTTAEPTTAAPTTEAPTTAVPTTAAPTTAEPTTATPTTAEPTTAEPTTAAPTTAVPTTAAPTTAEPTTAKPTTVAPTTESPTSAAPTTAAPTTATPTTGSPTDKPTDVPTRQPTAAPNNFLPCFESDTVSRDTFNTGFGDCASYTAGTDNHEFCDVDFDLVSGMGADAVCEECGTCNPPTDTGTKAPAGGVGNAPTQTPTAAPATAAPTTEAPVTSAPVTAAPVTSAPSTSSPVTEAPVTDAPVTDAPVTEAPVTGAPVTDAPVTDAPVTDAPVTSAPVTSAPVTAAPATDAPVTSAPVTSAPVTDAPVTSAPVTSAPVTDAPVPAAPVTAAPVTDAPVTSAPVTAAPVTSAPVTAAPVTPAPTGVPTTANPTFVPTSPAPTAPTIFIPCTSSQSCAQTGWAVNPFNTPGFDDVCASSFCDAACPACSTLDQAMSTCAAQGGRLCSIAELDAEVGRNTGCQLDQFYVWTRSRCPGGVLIAGGSGKSGLTPVCRQQLNFGDLNGVRCCADVTPVDTGFCDNGLTTMSPTTMEPTTASPTTPSPTNGPPTTATPTTPSPTNSPTAPTTAAPTPLVFNVVDRINSGGPDVLDAEGNLWRSDEGMSAGGNTIRPEEFVGVSLSHSFDPSTTPLEAVLDTERYGNLIYNIPIDGNGIYIVELLVIEAWHEDPAARVFEVSVQGVPTFASVSPYSEAGFQQPYFLSTTVHVTNGAANILIAFTQGKTSPQPPAVYGVRLSKNTGPPPTDAPTALTASPTTAAPTTPAPVMQYVVIDRINAGGPDVTDANGHTWRNDVSFGVGGGTVRPEQFTAVSMDYSNAPETANLDAVLDTERYGDVTYNIAVPGNGDYLIELLMVEAWHQSTGARFFTVNVGGVATAVNPRVDGGFQMPFFVTTPVSVTNGASTISVAFARGPGSPEPPVIFGIRVSSAQTGPVTGSPTAVPTTAAPVAATPAPITLEPTAPTTARPTSPPIPASYAVIDRVNCGGGTVIDSNFDIWRGDAFLGAGGKTVRPEAHIGVSLDYGSDPETAKLDPVLDVERYGALSYSLPIPGNGQYILQLLVVESWHPTPGTRLFNVDLQGSRVLSNFDALAERGFQTPFFKSINFQVTDGATSLSVQLSAAAGSSEPAAVYGLRLLAAQTPSPTTPPVEAAPVTAAPVTAAPVTPAPNTPPPNTPAPATAAPATSAPATGSPTDAETFFVIDRVNAGGSAVVDSAGHTWRSDSSLAPGGGTVRPEDFITVTMDYSAVPATAQLDAVLDTERYGDLTYSLAIPGNGRYKVDLLVVETWHNDAGARSFHVDVQGGRVFSNVNPQADSGFRTPYLLSTVLDVTNGASAISIVLTRASGSPEPPAVYGLVLSSTSASPVTAAPVTSAPVTSGPVTSAPVTSAPVTGSPVTSAPVTSAPVTGSPVTGAPVTSAPVTQAPVTSSPTTASPTTAEPTTAAPSTAAPTTEAPTTASPTTASPTPVPTVGEVAVENPCVSADSCADLASRGFIFSPHGTDNVAGVCAASATPSCNAAATFVEAAQACSAINARLCTANELANNAARGTGCSLDNKLVWSSTQCGEDSYLATGGSTKNTGSSCHAVDDTATAGIRCCGDAAPELARCVEVRSRRAAPAIEPAASSTSAVLGVGALVAGVIVAVVMVAVVVPRWRRVRPAAVSAPTPFEDGETPFQMPVALPARQTLRAEAAMRGPTSFEWDADESEATASL